MLTRGLPLKKTVSALTFFIVKVLEALTSFNTILPKSVRLSSEVVKLPFLITLPLPVICMGNLPIAFS